QPLSALPADHPSLLARVLFDTPACAERMSVSLVPLSLFLLRANQVSLRRRMLKDMQHEVQEVVIRQNHEGWQVSRKVCHINYLWTGVESSEDTPMQKGCGM